MKITRKFKPLFDLPKAWGEIERLSFIGLTEPEKEELQELIDLNESEDIDESTKERIKELRYKGLNTDNAKKLDYWIQLGGVSIVSISGGRESSKTFTASLASVDRVVNYGYRELYTRYTMKSASKSVIPSFLNRAKALNYTSYLKDTLTSVVCHISGGYVDFSGIKASSGNQSANLKSLENYCVFTVEEGEEFPTFEEWEKIELSFRSKDVQPFSVFILNPTTKKFWWFRKMFQERGVEDGFNGIKGNVLYIHTTYLDLGKKYVSRKNWIKFEAARVIYERIEALSAEERKEASAYDLRQWKYYKYTVLGGWKSNEDGLVYENWDLFDEFPTDYNIRIFGCDFGFSNDPLAFIECRIKGDEVWLKEHIYKTGLITRTAAPLMKAVLGEDAARCYIVADCNPKEIAEYAAEGLVMIPADKTFKGQGMNKMRGIRIMQGKILHVHKDSTNLIDELDHYHTLEVVNSKGETITHVVDKDDHLMDAMLYACTRY